MPACKDPNAKFIVNPATKRKVKVGSQFYKALVRKNLLKLDDEMDRNRVVHTASEAELDTLADTLKRVHAEINPAPPGKYYVRKNGAIRERKKTVSRLQLVDDITRRCVALFFKHKRTFAKDMTEGDMAAVMHDLIHRDLVGFGSELRTTARYVLQRPPKSNFDVSFTPSDIEASDFDTDVDDF